MPRRMGRPGLVGTMARTAVVAGTATAVSGKVAGSQQAKAQAQADAAAGAAQQQAAAAAPPAPEAADPMDEIRKYAEMKELGLLTEEEFSAKKAQILGI